MDRLQKGRKLYRGGRDYSEPLTQCGGMIFLLRLGHRPRCRPARSAVWDIQLAGAVPSCRLTDGKRTQARPNACWGHRCALKIALVFM